MEGFRVDEAMVGSGLRIDGDERDSSTGRKFEVLVGGRGGQGVERFQVMRKLKFLKGKVKSWSSEEANAIRVEKHRVLKRIEEIDLLKGGLIGQPFARGKERVKAVFFFLLLRRIGP
ncbi:hypothetical protein L484_016005 [Morus notabilis]|uniref:Uncharacterized protein n=1 Tax=Morus notabilis TaxID=981085 RepID=W9QZ72_9ROSA|nr:hypothetical protein L484_016005 [Morus notabilis]